jgi:hypothetical protein
MKLSSCQEQICMHLMQTKLHVTCLLQRLYCIKMPRQTQLGSFGVGSSIPAHFQPGYRKSGAEAQAAYLQAFDRTAIPSPVARGLLGGRVRELTELALPGLPQPPRTKKNGYKSCGSTLRTAAISPCNNPHILQRIIHHRLKQQ